MTARVSPFEVDDLSDFRPDSIPAPAGTLPASALDELAQKTGFPSRPVAPPHIALPTQSARPRRYTTGRDQQLNVKVAGGVKQRFLAHADAERIPLGALFEKMLAVYEQSREKGD